MNSEDQIRQVISEGAVHHLTVTVEDRDTKLSATTHIDIFLDDEGTIRNSVVKGVLELLKKLQLAKG